MRNPANKKNLFDVLSSKDHLFPDKQDDRHGTITLEEYKRQREAIEKDESED